jgi:chromosome partition protein MukF
MTIQDIIARTWKLNFSLSITPEDAAFLAGISAWLALNDEPTLDSDTLNEIFSIIGDLAYHDAVNAKVRATNALARLHEQRLLVRTDTAGISRSGEFSLTRIGKAVAEWLGEQEGLTRQELDVMMTRIRADLSVIKQAASDNGDALHWEQNVITPLKLTVSGLIELIDRRQQGMDVQQAEIRAQISALLEQAWFDAIQQCEHLLEDTGARLQELHRALMQEVEGISILLNEIEDLAEQAKQPGVSEAINHVRKQVERIGHWGQNRFEAWSEYFQNVHDFIRSVVQVDKDRAMRARLRDAVKQYGQPYWHLHVVEPPAYRHLREITAFREQEAVSRPRQQHRHELEEVQAEQTLLEQLEAELWLNLKHEGKASLVDILTRLQPRYERDVLYALAGKLAVWLAARGLPRPRRDTAWQDLECGISLQNLTVYVKKHDGQNLL